MNTTDRGRRVTAGSFDAVTAVWLAGYPVVLGVAALLRWWGLVINDEWLASMMVVMAGEFLGELLLARKKGTSVANAVTSTLTVDAMLLIGVAIAFAFQRLSKESDPDAYRWGHYTVLGVMVFLAVKYVRIGRYFGIEIPVLTAMIKHAESMFQGPVAAIREQEAHETGAQEERVVATAKVKEAAKSGAKVERAMAVQEYRDTGEVKTRTAVDMDVIEEIAESESGIIKKARTVRPFGSDGPRPGPGIHDEPVGGE